MKLGELIARTRKRKGLTAEQLAEKTGLSQSAISRIENGGRIGRPESIFRLTDALGIDPELVRLGVMGDEVPDEGEDIEVAVDPEWMLEQALAALRRRSEREETERKIAREEADLRARGLVGDVYRIPRAEQAASAGYGHTLDAEIGTISGPAPRVEDRISVKITGDCMEPDIPQGVVVTVDKTLTPQDGDVVLVSHDGEWICKWYEVQTDGSVLLIANQHREPIRPNGHTTVIGVVVDIQIGRPRKKR